MSKTLSYSIIFFLAVFFTKAQTNTLIGKYDEADKKKMKELESLARKEDSATFYTTLNKYRLDARQNNNYVLLDFTYYYEGVYWYFKGLPKTAKPYFDTASQISTSHGLDELSGSNYMSLGAVNYVLQNYSQSLRYYKNSEHYLLKVKSPKIVGLLGNISLLYQEIGDLATAKKYLNRSLPFIKLNKEPDSYAKALNNLGLIYKKEGNYHLADSMFKLGYKFTKENELVDDFSDITYNLSNVLVLQKKYAEAILYSEELLAFVKKHKDRSWIKLVMLELSSLYYEVNNVSAAKKYLNDAEQIAEEADVLDRDQKNSFLMRAKLYSALKMHEKANDYFIKYHNIDDNNNSENEILTTQQLGYKYQLQQDSLTNAKEKEITELANLNEKEKSDNRSRIQQIIIAVSLIGFVIIIGFSISLIKANRNKEKANKEITHQRGLLAEKNKEITDSITYAKRIQHSLLMPLDDVKKLLPEHFLIYLPKDIVSGDFYWLKSINPNEIFVAVADCTGHGVPGAMMSALSIQNLNELSAQTNSPAKLLTLLNDNIKSTLNQNQEGFSKDGLDICLCKINLSNKTLTYSGANRSLLIFNENGLKQEVKATKTGIAGHTDIGQIYDEHEVKLSAEDMAVMSTDGFADQFGGNEGKKITTKRFKEWITEIVLSQNKKTDLEQRFVRWKGANDQIDDVCVLGFKI